MSECIYGMFLAAVEKVSNRKKIKPDAEIVYVFSD